MNKSTKTSVKHGVFWFLLQILKLLKMLWAVYELIGGPSCLGQRAKIAVSNTTGRRGNLTQASCGNTPNFIAKEVALSCPWQGVKRPVRVSEGQLGGWCVPQLLHRGVTWEARDTRGLCVCMCWQHVKRAVERVSLLQVALLLSHVRCVLSSAWTDPRRGHPFSLSTRRQLYGDASGYSIKLNNYSTKGKHQSCYTVHFS